METYASSEYMFQLLNAIREASGGKAVDAVNLQSMTTLVETMVAIPELNAERKRALVYKAVLMYNVFHSLDFPDRLIRYTREGKVKPRWKFW